MGSVLHLAHAHEPPPGPARKRKGGGGGSDGYDDVVEQIYRDPRMGRETREIALMLAWLIGRDPNRFDAGVWVRAEAILGFRKYGRHTQSVAALLVADDLPRYEMDRAAPEWLDQTCDAPMIRRAGLCGQPAVDNSYTVDLTTGWRTPVWFCRRHAEFGRDRNLALAETGAPEPIPNRGGLLPCYFSRKSGPNGWVQNYKWAAHTADPWLREEWMPPKHGVYADEWPTPGKESEPHPPRLRLLIIDEEEAPRGDR
ncbi:hypothetical protein [Streptomyces tendae]|uniref:hypothetical protein n=1 Tax=Streptomyces tendae TaxID=1932 RepID=UPI003D75E7D2